MYECVGVKNAYRNQRSSYAGAERALQYKDWAAGAAARPPRYTPIFVYSALIKIGAPI